MEENTDLLEHLNKFNMLNTQLLNFAVKIGEEDKAILLLLSLPHSYDHMVTTLSYGKETQAFEEVTRSLLSLRSKENLSMIRLMGLWYSLSQSVEDISLKGRMA